MYLAKIEITLKNGILDPQGKTVQHALHNLGFKNINEVRIGKSIHLKIDSRTPQEAEAIIHKACKKLLANPVIEEYSFELTELNPES